MSSLQNTCRAITECRLNRSPIHCKRWTAAWITFKVAIWDLKEWLMWAWWTPKALTLWITWSWNLKRQLISPILEFLNLYWTPPGHRSVIKADTRKKETTPRGRAHHRPILVLVISWHTHKSKLICKVSINCWRTHWWIKISDRLMRQRPLTISTKQVETRWEIRIQIKTWTKKDLK